MRIPKLFFPSMSISARSGPGAQPWSGSDRGKNEDMTSARSIWRMTWPQMLMMVAHFFVGFVDVLVAGRLGRDVQASLGIIAQSLFVFLIVGMAVSNGSVAAISQSLGAGLVKRARRYIGLSLQLCAVFSLLLMLVAYFFGDEFMGLLQVPAELRPVTEYFFHVYLILLPAYYLLVVTNAFFRAHRWVHLPLITMTLVTVVNTILDFGLGLGMWGMPNMGYQGVAWATFGSVLAGALLNLVILFRKRLLTRDTFPPRRWIKRAWRYLFKVAWPTGLAQVLWQTAYLVLYAITASLPHGSIEALAGMTTGMRIEAALFMPGFAFNMTASILVGHTLGQNRPADAKRLGYKILGLGVGSIAGLSVIVWIWAEPLVAFLAPDAAVQVEALNYLFYNILAIPFTVGGMILGGVMNGAGATIYNTAVFGFSSWFIRLPLAWLLGHVVIGAATGVWAAMLISQTFQALIMLGFYQFGNWARFSMLAHRQSRNGAS